MFIHGTSKAKKNIRKYELLYFHDGNRMEWVIDTIFWDEHLDSWNSTRTFPCSNESIQKHTWNGRAASKLCRNGKYCKNRNKWREQKNCVTAGRKAPLCSTNEVFSLPAPRHDHDTTDTRTNQRFNSIISNRKHMLFRGDCLSALSLHVYELFYINNSKSIGFYIDMDAIYGIWILVTNEWVCTSPRSDLNDRPFTFERTKREREREKNRRASTVSENRLKFQ